DPDDHRVLVEGGGKITQDRRLVLAGRAPRSPEVEDHRLTPEMLQGDLLAIERLEREGWCGAVLEPDEPADRVDPAAARQAGGVAGDPHGVGEEAEKRDDNQYDQRRDDAVAQRIL